MLILSRRINEALVITVPPSTEPTKVLVIPTEVHAHQVRIGIEAPKRVTVDREEVHKRKALEQQS